MDQRAYHGDIGIDELSDLLVATFDQGNLRAQRIGASNRAMVQIATREWNGRGGQAALTVTISRIADGVTVALGQHEWLGAAASLMQTGLMGLLNPISLITRLEDIAQDVNSFALPAQVWAVVDQYCHSVGASLAMSERLRSVVCPYCGVGNTVGQGSCSACGAPLGDSQPRTCPHCGNVMAHRSRFCDVCGTPLA